MKARLNWYHLDLFAEMYSEAYLNALVETLPKMGCNGIVLELTDRVNLRTVADYGSLDGLSVEGLRALCDRIRAHGMEVVPLLQQAAHMEHILKRETYRHLREKRDSSYSICRLHPETRPLLEKILAEILEAMGEVNYVHLGGDEAEGEASCPRCAGFVEHSSEIRLYIDHIGWFCRKVLERGARPILWHDVVCAHPESLGELPAETILLDWNYGRYTPDGFGATELMRSRGFDVILGSSCRCHGDSQYFPSNGRHLPNIVCTAEYGRQSDVLGTCITDWSVRLNPPGPRMLGIATGLWGTYAGLDEAGSAERLAVWWCGLPPGSGSQLLQASYLLSERPPLTLPHWGMLDRTSWTWHGLDVEGELAKINIAKERKKLPGLREKYQQARAMTKSFVEQAEDPGRAWLEQWDLSAESLLVRVEVLEAIFDRAEGKPDVKREARLLDEMAALEARSRQILGPIYSPETLEMQMTIRFEGERAYFRGG